MKSIKKTSKRNSDSIYKFLYEVRKRTNSEKSKYKTHL